MTRARGVVDGKRRLGRWGLAIVLASAPAGAEPPATTASAPNAAAPTTTRWGGADATYVAAVHGRIHPRWSTFLTELHRLPPASRYQDTSLTAEVVLTVDADGLISHLERTRGSGLEGFDDAPIDLLRDLARLPPPPAALRSDDGKVYLRWTFTRHEPGCEAGGVIERRLPVEQAVVGLLEAGRWDEAAARVDEARRAEPAKEAALLQALLAALGRVEARQADPARRAAAAPVLGRVAGGEPFLLLLVGDGDRQVARAALAALGTPPREAAGRGALARALASSDGSDVAAAADAMARLGDAAAVPSLQAALARSDSPVAAAALARALVALGGRPQAIDGALKLLGGDAAARLAGAEAARAIAEPGLAPALTMALGGAREELRGALVEALAATGAKAPAEARKAILHALSDGAPKVRARAFLAATRLGDRSAALRSRFLDALADPDPGVRAAVYAGLVEIAGAAAADEIARGARDRSPTVRAALARAVVAHPYAGAGPLVARLEKDADPQVVAALANAAGTSGATVEAPPPSATLVPSLLSARDPLERLRLGATWLAETARR